MTNLVPTNNGLISTPSWRIMSRRMTHDSLLSDNLRSNDDIVDLNFFKCNEILEFRIQNLPLPPADDHYAAAAVHPLPLWMCRSPADSDEYEISHLLSRDYHAASSLPPPPPVAGRIQAGEDGQKLLMEIIQSMPESSYELSLRDIIDQHNQQILKEESQSRRITASEENFIAKIQPNFPRRKNYKSMRVRSSASRSIGMQGRGFQLKMFVPFFLVFNKKSKKGICSAIPSGELFVGRVKSKPETKDRCEIIEMEFSDEMDKEKCGSVSKNRLLQSKFPYCW